MLYNMNYLVFSLLWYFLVSGRKGEVCWRFLGIVKSPNT
ncbi:EC1118_1D0_8273p [Saccharomyces cerevisiae EC1118]|uniref:EC1118_1D0_8273p n=1 Tax=Saccharomyces cerevisiae (strain Lalvin EC1118 / Prise de mousse) TaxID=643680 RepID=C8Z667_YEAS8|nr:EC1118_1D0_8273p [Saccharomyces cerevisiae EC1118]